MLRTRSMADRGALKVFDPETRAFLESGCGLLVGTVSADGEPARGPGLGPGRRSSSGRRPACACCSTPTTSARSSTWPRAAPSRSPRPTCSRCARCSSRGERTGSRRRHPRTTRTGRRATSREFLADVAGHRSTCPGSSFERFFPAGYVACLVEVARAFDQTPGPGAGARVEVERMTEPMRRPSCGCRSSSAASGRDPRGDRHRRPPTARRTSPTCRGCTGSTTSGSRCRTSSSRRRRRTWPRTRGRACC